MGIQYDVHFENEIPPFAKVRELLARSGKKFGMRMIDGELAYPDDEPPATWSELRVALAKEMITLRRAGSTVSVLAWGNADDSMRQAWEAVTWAIAESGRGLIHDEGRTLSPEEFAVEKSIATSGR